MSCSLRDLSFPKGDGVRVNGVAVPRDLIAQEAQHHPSRTPAEALRAAARSLVVRELLLQEARRIGIDPAPMRDGAGRSETEEEALVRGLIEREIRTPEPDQPVCRRYYEQNRKSFCSATIHEAAHILLPARNDDANSFAEAKRQAIAICEALKTAPERFADLARQHSACSSAAQGGNLGQLTGGQTTPEFEAALCAMPVGTISSEPVASRYGLHIIRLDRRIEGRELPYEIVAEHIADYLRESVSRRATAQYIARLVSRADVTGVSLDNAEVHRVN